MTLPTVQTSDDWCDLEDNYSMLLLQGLVDHEMRFLDINFIWRSRDKRMLSWWGWLYPLLPWLITPYESNGLPASVSDVVHGAARSLAVTALSQLKGTWRILNKVRCDAEHKDGSR
ncbi:hypothetical protein L3X38_015146 [Prunus dulcis]|uniref:Uncharacterized protein n=1 Tax=Prunus dulcis TaxID=3755 RepID=A0AAD4WS67_PRUDU|nr:hypothetical protein L3X38_015146 [Prunus dulcis]